MPNIIPLVNILCVTKIQLCICKRPMCVSAVCLSFRVSAFSPAAETLQGFKVSSLSSRQFI